MTKKNWRDAKFVNQLENMDDYSIYDNQYSRKWTRFYQCKKYVCVDKVTGRKTTGIEFNSGKVRVGDDVWRLSNPLDICEYPFISFKNMNEASKEYAFFDVPSSIPFYIKEEVLNDEIS